MERTHLGLGSSRKEVDGWEIVPPNHLLPKKSSEFRA